MPDPLPVAMKNRAAWRSWLVRNHATMKEVWLIHAKKQSGIQSVSYDEAVEEAICFGWIDGQTRAVDDRRFMQRFTPRRTGSRWSELNIARAEKMIAAGLMTATGKAVFDEAMQQKRTVPSRNSYTIPVELEAALASNPAAGRNFRDMAPTHRLMFSAWVGSAKRAETRLRRAEKSIALLEENRRLMDRSGDRKKSGNSRRYPS